MSRKKRLEVEIEIEFRDGRAARLVDLGGQGEKDIDALIELFSGNADIVNVWVED